MKFCGMCFNWKVIGGLAAVGVVLWVAAPGAFTTAGPILLALACPLSMVFMMRGMQGAQGTQRNQGQGVQVGACAMAPEQTGRASEALASPAADAARSTRAEDLAGLHAELTRIQARQAAIALELAELERQTDSPAAVREAEAVAAAAEWRPAAR